jgi:hypothetical protein
MNPSSEASVPGFRVRGKSPRPGMTGREMIGPLSSQVAHAGLQRAEGLTLPSPLQAAREVEF